MYRQLLGTLAAEPVVRTTLHTGQIVTTLRVAHLPHIRNLRRGERREDYERILVFHFLGDVASPLLRFGTPLNITVTDRPHRIDGKLEYPPGTAQITVDARALDM